MSKTLLIAQLGKLRLAVEREGELFWWKPWAEGHIQRNPFWQDCSNYYWHLSIGWLWYSAEIYWQKSRWGWHQTSIEQHDPFVGLWWKS